MSVFDFQETDTGRNEDKQVDAGEDEERDVTVKSVTVMESGDGHGGTRHRSYIPADISRGLGLSGGDTLLMRHVEGEDEVIVRKP